ncbi:MAG: FGGY family carbohydrate kinase [Phycisphaerae bacterium]|nr:FGGY family carbohydrate kinase [Phycisphaerae bacterium]MDD5380396.1 FGGY family carbohydrate kinase [Phycisphaerae bacterium]
MTLLLGYDVGSSSIKATLMNAETGEALAAATSPKKEMEIIAKKFGWAEQNPSMWWEHVVKATQMIKSQTDFNAADVKAIGISYQMHGLVIVGKNKEVLRPSIIWCDGRAVQLAKKAAAEIGEKKCLETMLNLPGNFTASKLKWVMENEPDIYSKVYKMMLPGDYVAMKMTGEIKTTFSGLSEGIIWDYKEHKLAKLLLDYYGISEDLIAEAVPTFSVQGELAKAAADELGLKAGTKISYRAGDQPNNALSLNVLNPGEIAATAGTSGVVYGITEKSDYDSKSRVNAFIHVTHTQQKPRYGVLLCVSGTGILNSWLKHNATDGLDYPKMDELAGGVKVGSDGLVVLPYGNGAERTLENKDPGASIHGLNFNLHSRAHLLRAAQEGIVFALNYGVGIMRRVGVDAKTVRAGHANMFLSPIFSEAFATITGSVVELYNTDGSQGAARGAGIGAGIYKSPEAAFAGLKPVKKIEPNNKLSEAYKQAYEKWELVLKHQMERSS